MTAGTQANGPFIQPSAASDSDDSASDVATLTASALAFSKIKPLDFSATFNHISKDPSLLTEETTDALLVEAFTVAMKGQEERARQCVEKGQIGRAHV